MHILMPMRPNSDPNLLHEASADEFYAGFMDRGWDKHHRIPGNDLNRMSGFGRISNYGSLEQLQDVLESTRSAGFPIHVTLNGNGYDDWEQKYVLKLCEKLTDIGFSSIIIGDPITIKMACEAGYNITVSTIAGVYNSDLAAYYRDMGVKRIILPRDLTLEEIESIMTKNPMDYEVFLMQNGCKYSDSSCTCNHGIDTDPTCSKLHKSNKQYVTDGDLNTITENNQLFENIFHKPACGLCAIYHFLKLGVKAVKIVGRANNNTENVEVAKLVRSNINIARGCKTEQEYLDQMIRPDNLKDCNGLCCYYPDARFR